MNDDRLGSGRRSVLRSMAALGVGAWAGGSVGTAAADESVVLFDRDVVPGVGNGWRRTILLSESDTERLRIEHGSTGEQSDDDHPFQIEVTLHSVVDDVDGTTYPESDGRRERRRSGIDSPLVLDEGDLEGVHAVEIRARPTRQLWDGEGFHLTVEETGETSAAECRGDRPTGRSR